jgi:histidyl-tRNA synthetase
MVTANKAPQARLPKGFRDTSAEELRETSRILARIREVYETYGFAPLETPALEFTDALGKFLPDQDRPNAGVFSLRDEDGQWLSLRYDLTAPLARFVAENFDALPKPFRRYAFGPVWRNEKPGPGRFRQFTQFDADTVGTDSLAADAEICMLAADTLDALGIARGDYLIKVSSRRLFEGVLEAIGLTDTSRRLTVLRAIDKFDRLGLQGVRQLLGAGRKDESGDFTKGAELDAEQIRVLLMTLAPGTIAGRESAQRSHAGLQQPDASGTAGSNVSPWAEGFPANATVAAAVNELQEIEDLVRAAGYGGERICIDPSVVRGLEYYTGPVFEAELTFAVKNEDGQSVRFGAIGGGGRYDALVERFMGRKVPATGFSIGVSRLQAALSHLGRGGAHPGAGPVVVIVMDKERIADYQRLAQRLRQPDDGGPPIAAEMYLGNAGMKAQMKYADKRASPCVIIQGGDERAKGVVQVKDLIEGAKAAASISDSKEWRASRPAQICVPETDLLAAVRRVLARHSC